MRLSNDELTALLAAHGFYQGETKKWCVTCVPDEWPCETVRLATEVRDLRAVRDANPVPVRQTKFGDPDGNCLEACFASLTGIPLDEIPHFLNDGWFGSYARWFQERGWELVYWHGDETEAPVGYAIASGPAIRGLDHSTIYLNGKLHHDPHPSGAGLEAVHDWMILVRKVRVLARYEEGGR